MATIHRQSSRTREEADRETADALCALQYIRVVANNNTVRSWNSWMNWDALSPTSAELVAHMGNRGGWNVDALCKAIGLPANAGALMMLELAGTVRRDVCGDFVATGAMQRRATMRDPAAPS